MVLRTLFCILMIPIVFIGVSVGYQTLDAGSSVQSIFLDSNNVPRAHLRTGDSQSLMTASAKCSDGNICATTTTTGPDASNFTNLSSPEFVFQEISLVRINDVVIFEATINIKCAGAGFWRADIDLNTGIPEDYRTTAMTTSLRYGSGLLTRSSGQSAGILTQQSSGSVLIITGDCDAAGTDSASLNLQYPI